MKPLILALSLTGALTGAAYADCRAALNLDHDSKPSSLSKAVVGHEHIQAAVTKLKACAPPGTTMKRCCM